MRLHVQASATHRELSADVGPGSTESGGGGTRGKHRTRLRSTLASTLQKQNMMMPFKRSSELTVGLWRSVAGARRRPAVARACGAPPVGTPIFVRSYFSSVLVSSDWE